MTNARSIAVPMALVSSLALAACGAIDQEVVLEEFGNECISSFAAEVGLSEELAKPFCDCSIKEMKEQDFGITDLVNEEKMSAIGEACITEVMDAPTPPE
ncbi:MAG: hypothetical protein AAF127_03620 [Pseudomonadota bacterium]